MFSPCKASPYVVSIEGNIGSGKSSVISFLQDYFGDSCFSIAEPVNKWTNFFSPDPFINQIARWRSISSPFNLLAGVYSDPFNYAHRMCYETLFTSVMNQIEARNATFARLSVIERCCLSSVEVFASQGYRSMLEIDRIVIDSMFKHQKRIIPLPNLIIFLESPNINELMTRIQDLKRQTSFLHIFCMI